MLDELGIGACVIYATLMLLWQISHWFYRVRGTSRDVVAICVTHNAERDVEGVLRAYAHQCHSLNSLLRVIVIDAHSTDLTVEIVRRFSKQFMQVELIETTSVDDALREAKKIVADAPCEARIDYLGFDRSFSKEA